MHIVRTALKMLFSMIVLTGLIYPLLLTFIAQFTMPRRAGGSLIWQGDRIIGSRLIAQNFKGEAYFWPRPSAVHFDPIQPAGGSNLGPTSQKLKEAVEERTKAWGSHPPAELVYTSASGLDPHISLEAAYFQLDRVAKARGISDKDQLRSLIDSLAEGFGKKYVNVLLLNQKLDQRFPSNHYD
jgi:K+-transporting ATPase ATPase C chain